MNKGVAEMVTGFNREILAERMERNVLKMDYALRRRRYDDGVSRGYDGRDYANEYYENFQELVALYIKAHSQEGCI